MRSHKAPIDLAAAAYVVAIKSDVEQPEDQSDWESDMEVAFREGWVQAMRRVERYIKGCGSELE